VRAALAVAAVVGLLAPAVATASMRQESIFEDSTVLLQRGVERQASGLTEIAALGADTVRSLVLWRDVVPSPDARRRPPGFASGRVTSYPAALWDRYDDLVRGARARGLRVLLTPSSTIPRWASGCRRPPAVLRGCAPNPELYEGFVRVLGRRYSGAYRDENQGGGELPRVERWSLWNEPNQPGWLSPQYERRGGRLVNTGARRYRALAGAGIRALRATGHGSDHILLGETSPVGRTAGPPARRAAPPVGFLQALFCLDQRGRRLRGAAARATGCGDARRLGVSGFAHHPYTQGAHDAPGAPPSPGQISFLAASQLERLLRQGARAKLIPANLPIWFTEFGYQTNPPDPRLGVAPALQATYLNQADYVAARNPRIRSVAQYKLVDDRDQQAFQTGLRRFGSLALKPAYAAYRLPVWVVRTGAGVQVYGQLRSAGPGDAPTVEIQRSPPAGSGFRTVRAVRVTSRTGQFLATVPGAPEGLWRLVWTPDGGAAQFSRSAVASGR